jgi:hypothetical protein
MSGAAEQIHTINQMETPKSSLGVFELPCGYLDPETKELVTEVQVREITGNEEDMLASNKVPPGQKISSLLSGCVVRVGEVTDRGKLSRMVQQLPMGDRVYLIFCIRRVTLGDELPVREACPECKVKSLFMVDLGMDLEIKKMEDPTQRVFDFTLPSGPEVRLRVSTGADEERMAKLARQNRMDSISQAILMRLELLGGEKPTLPMVKNLGMRDRNFIREKFQEVEGGVDTGLDFVCPSCGNEWRKELDLSASGFFFPGGVRNR